ncbi:glutamate synthase large subunit [Marinospirillum perlucidum]|uniref:glutamate synthase large subunit n=1 Tax=Marinospirillum perlucidum TaxID=1982602 RepID=UPI000DF3E8AF|nr:glutamate synthase large subunit [Marinospirillum perlucidum]
MNAEMKKSQGLYCADLEHDSCGIGFVANLKGKKSHQIIEDALSMLTCMEHRGGTGFDVKSGDGAGILIQIPDELLRASLQTQAIQLPEAGGYGVGMLFLPQDAEERQTCRNLLESSIQKLGMRLLGYREVPTDNSGLGQASLDNEPQIQQVFIAPGEGWEQQAFERKLYVLRKHTTHLVEKSLDKAEENFYIASMSTRTLVYKGQLTTAQVREYYLDLQNEKTVSALAMHHSRFSTNTFPAWRLAQPFRYLAHNGEINTVKGNINWMRARDELLSSDYFSDEELQLLKPICNTQQSDSANMDMVVELLLLSGRPLEKVMMMMIPEAWQKQEDMEAVKRAFYEYYACIMEPWDGPASVSFTDGRVIGATLDRNGLRPSRYLVTEDDTLVMGSETGALVVDESKVIQKGRLQPGRIFIADLEQGRIISDDEVKAEVCSSQPYADWLKKNKIVLDELPAAPIEERPHGPKSLLRRQQAFGYSREDLDVILTDMVGTAKEPLGSMGADNPLAILSDQPQHLANYFKQFFAQVTNPPIDPIREEMVMSLQTYVGSSLNLLDETPEHCRMVEIKQPVLTNEELLKLQHIDHNHFQSTTVDITFRSTGKAGELKRALDRICRHARDAVEDGYSILILSDRKVNTDHAGVPSLLATAAVHHYLIREGLRSSTGILVEAGDVRETHHFATLLGYGAAAVNPYMAFESLYSLRDQGAIAEDWSNNELVERYIKAVNGGLLKIFSKMGISTLQSYQGAQIFEALGLSQEVIDNYFAGTISRIGGLGLDEIAEERLMTHRVGYPAAANTPASLPLRVGGDYSWRKGGERHLFSPKVIRLLQQASATKDKQLFEEYTREVDDQARAAFTLRGLLDWNPEHQPVPLEEVESAENIFKRFATGAMSFGSISWEAHTCLAIAMNRLGGKSNSGEGGEDPRRFVPLENGDSMLSKIKQVASGRFGVTSHYLTHAEELQIKMAQGAKPGEGGQLPGHKVDAWIGKTRLATPGVGLISPPPHHDIYSIEDLAQLIYDLKNANREARVNVKLVSLAGVGTIATGVTKGYADVVLIAGHDGGTGASPLSSIKHAGLPWELGLAESHQTLVRNRLRSRVTLQADGQMKTPRDLAIATLLGAEEWGVATAALVAQGCIMMRKCHTNTCPVGIATQDRELRGRYNGQVEHVVNFFQMMVEGLREIMAELGFRSINEMVGQSQCLKVRPLGDHWKLKNLDLSPLLHKEEAHPEDTLYKSVEQKHLIHKIIDRRLLEDAQSTLENQTALQLDYPIENTDRSVGAMVSNEISKRYGAEGLPEDTLKVHFTGSAGQSFGVFTTAGVRFDLEGDANDYFGKGLSGGKLVVYPNQKARFKASDNILIGNVALFGATSGEAFIRGLAGERFCVRNSGATAVVEGIGDHGCEYMTGGCAVILGETGRNFAAGMSGGVAYVLNRSGQLDARCNKEMVKLGPVSDQAEAERLKTLVQKHYQLTGSEVAAELLENWEKSLQEFTRVMPVDYERMQGYMQQVREEKQLDDEYEVAVEAFDLHLKKLADSKATA